MGLRHPQEPAAIVSIFGLLTPPGQFVRDANPLLRHLLTRVGRSGDEALRHNDPYRVLGTLPDVPDVPSRRTSPAGPAAAPAPRRRAGQVPARRRHAYLRRAGAHEGDATELRIGPGGHEWKYWREAAEVGSWGRTTAAGGASLVRDRPSRAAPRRTRRGRGDGGEARRRRRRAGARRRNPALRAALGARRPRRACASSSGGPTTAAPRSSSCWRRGPAGASRQCPYFVECGGCQLQHLEDARAGALQGRGGGGDAVARRRRRGAAVAGGGRRRGVGVPAAHAASHRPRRARGACRWATSRARATRWCRCAPARSSTRRSRRIPLLPERLGRRGSRPRASTCWSATAAGSRRRRWRATCRTARCRSTVGDFTYRLDARCFFQAHRTLSAAGGVGGGALGGPRRRRPLRRRGLFSLPLGRRYAAVTAVEADRVSARYARGNAKRHRLPHVTVVPQAVESWVGQLPRTSTASSSIRRATAFGAGAQGVAAAPARAHHLRLLPRGDAGARPARAARPLPAREPGALRPLPAERPHGERGAARCATPARLTLVSSSCAAQSLPCSDRSTSPGSGKRAQHPLRESSSPPQATSKMPPDFLTSLASMRTVASTWPPDRRPRLVASHPAVFDDELAHGGRL